jgi:hypothetical protein
MLFALDDVAPWGPRSPAYVRPRPRAPEPLVCRRLPSGREVSATIRRSWGATARVERRVLPPLLCSAQRRTRGGARSAAGDSGDRSVEVDGPPGCYFLLFHFAQPVRRGDARPPLLAGSPGQPALHARVLPPEAGLLGPVPGLPRLRARGAARSWRPAAADDRDVQAVVRELVSEREPEYRTVPFRRFWRGAYESVDRVEAWWYARELVYTGMERRGGVASLAPRRSTTSSPRRGGDGGAPRRRGGARAVVTTRGSGCCTATTAT